MRSLDELGLTGTPSEEGFSAVCKGEISKETGHPNMLLSFCIRLDLLAS